MRKEDSSEFKTKIQEAIDSTWKSIFEKNAGHFMEIYVGKQELYRKAMAEIKMAHKLDADDNYEEELYLKKINQL